MKKIISLILVVLCIMSAFLLAGCGEKNNNALVYFLNSDSESAPVYEELAEKYEEEKGVKVKVVTSATDNYEQTLKSEIAKTEAPTIFLLNGLTDYDNWKDYCLDINDSNLYSYLTNKTLAIKSGDGVYAVPYNVEGYGIVYNNSVMDKYFALKNRQNKINSMKEIKGFNSLKTVVEDMTKHKKELNIDGVFATASFSGDDWRWQTHLLNVPLYYEYKTNENPALSLFDTEQIAFKYEKNFKNILDLYIENSSSEKNILGSKTAADSLAEFALSKVAMIQNGNWAWQQISNVNGNTVKEDDIKMLPVYVGIDGEENQGICVGAENYLAVNKNVSEEKRKASLDFLNWLFSSETGKKYVTEKLGFLPPFNTFSDDELPDNPLAKEINSHIKDEKVFVVPWIFTAFPGEDFNKEVGNGLLDYINGKSDWDAFKKNIIEKWKIARSKM